MKNAEKRIAEIREELHEIYQNDNEAPRLIHEMMPEFPYPRKIMKAADESSGEQYTFPASFSPAR